MKNKDDNSTKSGQPSNFHNRNTKTQNVNEDTEETSGDENKENYLEYKAETNEESFEETLSEQLESTKHDSLEVDKNVEVTKL